MVKLAIFLKNWSLQRSNRVTRQVSVNRTKIVEKLFKGNCYEISLSSKDIKNMGTVQVNGVEIIYDLFKNIVSFIMGTTIKMVLKSLYPICV